MDYTKTHINSINSGLKMTVANKERSERNQEKLYSHLYFLKHKRTEANTG